MTRTVVILTIPKAEYAVELGIPVMKLLVRLHLAASKGET